MKRFTLTGRYCFIIFLFSIDLSAQTGLEIKLLDRGGENLSETMIDLLEDLKNHPLNLNTVRKKQLGKLPLVSLLQVELILLEKKQNGPFLSWKDFKLRIEHRIPEIALLQPYVCFKLNHNSDKKLVSRSRFAFSRKRPRPSIERRFKGSRHYSYNRLHYRRNEQFETKLLFEKDSGEKSIIDHISGYCRWQTNHQHTNIIIGDYLIETGQGLTFHGPWGACKGADPLYLAAAAPKGIIGYAASDENRFFRGLAAEAIFGSITLLLQVSYKQIDARIDESNNIVSFPLTGLHRTSAEIKNKNRISQTSWGGNINYSFSRGRVGLSARGNLFEFPKINKYPEKKHYAFKGLLNQVMGIDGALFINNWTFISEAAISKSGGSAFTATALRQNPGQQFICIFRNISAAFHNNFSQFLGDSPVSNQTGLYFGFKTKIFHKSKINIYADFSKTMWRTYSLPLPGRKKEIFLEFDNNVNRYLSCKFRARLRTDNGWQKLAADIQNNPRAIILRKNLQLRLDMTYQPFKFFRIRSRFEKKYINRLTGNLPLADKPLKETADLWFAEIFTRIPELLQIQARITFFSTPSWDSRIYSFENGVPGSFRITPYYYSGRAGQLILQTLVSKKYRISAKIYLADKRKLKKRMKNHYTTVQIQMDLSI